MFWINLLALNRNSISEFEISGLDHPNQSLESGVLGFLPMKLSNKLIVNIIIIDLCTYSPIIPSLSIP